MSYSVFVDPGKHGCGYALFRDGSLVDAGWAQPDLPAQVNPTERSVAVADEVVSAVHLAGGLPVQVFLHERMEDQGRAYATKNILDLATVCGALAVGFNAPEVHCPRPSDWKGQTSKEVIWRRTIRTLGPRETEQALAFVALAPKQRQHDVCDAIALGTWFHNGKSWRKK